MKNERGSEQLWRLTVNHLNLFGPTINTKSCQKLARMGAVHGWVASLIRSVSSRKWKMSVSSAWYVWVNEMKGMSTSPRHCVNVNLTWPWILVTLNLKSWFAVTEVARDFRSSQQRKWKLKHQSSYSPLPKHETPPQLESIESSQVSRRAFNKPRGTKQCCLSLPTEHNLQEKSMNED